MDGVRATVVVGYLARMSGGLGPAHYVALVSLVGVASAVYMMRTRRAFGA